MLHNAQLVIKDWNSLTSRTSLTQLESFILPEYIRDKRWFGGKSRIIETMRIVKHGSIASAGAAVNILLIDVTYQDGLPELYQLPVGFISLRQAQTDKDAARLKDSFSQAIIARLKIGDEEGYLYDAIYGSEFQCAIIDHMKSNEPVKQINGELIEFKGKEELKQFETGCDAIKPRVLSADQSNTSVVYGKNFFLKLFRKLDYAINSDAEISGFLTDESKFEHMPTFVGTFQWKSNKETITLGLIQKLVENSGDGWTYVLDRLDELNEKLLASPDILTLPDELMTFNADTAYDGRVNPVLHEIFSGPLTEQVRLLGIRTAELHKALAARSDIAAFAPEPYSLHYQRSLFSGLKSLVRSAFQNQSGNLEKLAPEVRGLAEEILGRQSEILIRLKDIYRKKIDVSKIRIHGDYHLGQVLFTGKDFVITDFEGEPARSYTERRLKRSPLRDVAGMIRSFHYAAYASLFLDNHIRKDDYPKLIPVMEAWYHHISHVFMEAYKENVQGTPFIPKSDDELETLMTTFLLEKAIYEMNYELNNRPDWVIIPLTGIKAILDAKQNKVEKREPVEV